MAKSLMPMLDEVSGNECDAIRYALGNAVHDWLWSQLNDPARVELIERAASDGVVRLLTAPDGSEIRRSFPPGASAIMAAITSP